MNYVLIDKVPNAYFSHIVKLILTVYCNILINITQNKLCCSSYNFIIILILTIFLYLYFYFVIKNMNIWLIIFCKNVVYVLRRIYIY